MDLVNSEVLILSQLLSLVVFFFPLIFDPQNLSQLINSPTQLTCLYSFALSQYT